MSLFFTLFPSVSACVNALKLNFLSAPFMIALIWTPGGDRKSPYKIESACPPVRQSGRVLGIKSLVSFLNFGMVLEIYVKLCVPEPDFLKGPEILFLQIIRKS